MESSGAGDAFASATAPLTWHDFLERMRHPSAADFVKSIKSFIVTFSNTTPEPDVDSRAVQEFLARMEDAFRAHPLWANSSQEELDSAAEGLEKYVMTKLYSRTFATVPEDATSDEELFEKIGLIQQFIRPENLDIKPEYQNETSWLLAIKELQKINSYKAPRDKLVCILNCCKVITNLLVNASVSNGNSPPGADEFLPVLIYVTIKANPPQLHSNLQYIQRFRRQTRLVLESAYFFTNILSAESFIWNIDGRALSMDDSDFEKKMNSARDSLLGLGNTSNNSNTSLEKKMSLDNGDLDLEKKGSSELLKEDELAKYFEEYPYLYARAGDLSVSDVHDLLGCYKRLVLQYVSLSKGIGEKAKPEEESELKNTENEEVRDVERETETLTNNEPVKESEPGNELVDRIDDGSA